MANVSFFVLIRNFSKLPGSRRWSSASSSLCSFTATNGWWERGRSLASMTRCSPTEKSFRSGKWATTAGSRTQRWLLEFQVSNSLSLRFSAPTNKSIGLEYFNCFTTETFANTDGKRLLHRIRFFIGSQCQSTQLKNNPF